MAILGLGSIVAVHAAPITFTDIYNPTDVYLSNSGTNTYTFTHNILNEGFVPSLYNILNADIYITMADDGDRASENVRISLDNLVVAHAMDVDSGAYHFTVNSTLLQDDGLLVVNLNVLSGDFYFQKSELDVTAEAVPEPGTLALTGMGLLGLGFAFRRKRV